jgi:hypothetical protein
MLREMTAERREEFSELMRRYDHVGGADIEWVKYQHREDVLAGEGFYHYGEEEELLAACAVLAVGRMKDALLRKIKATVPGNYLLRSIEELWPDLIEYRDMGLLGGGVLRRVFACHDLCRWAGLDLNNCFTSYELPPWMWRLQGGPSILLEDVPPSKILGRWKDKDPKKFRVRPYYKRLAMGSYIAVFLIMCIMVKKAQKLSGGFLN